MKPHSLIRTIYLYLITAITIIMVIVAMVNVIKMGLEYVFDVKSYEEIGRIYECDDRYGANHYLGKPPVPPTIEPTQVEPLTEEEKTNCLKAAEEERKERAANNRKRDVIWSLAMLIVALPLYFYHWKTIQKNHS
jgi:hypothetical protein